MILFYGKEFKCREKKRTLTIYLMDCMLLKVYQMELKISEVISLLYLLRLVRNYFLNVISTFLCFRGE